MTPALRPAPPPARLRWALRRLVAAAIAALAMAWTLPVDGPAPPVDPMLRAHAAMAERLARLHPASGPHAMRIVRAVHAEAQRHRLDPCTVMGVIARESGFRPLARNDRDLGLMQLNTRWHADRVAQAGGAAALLDVERNVRAGTELLAHYRERAGSERGALQRYHGLGKRNDYVARVLAEAGRLRAAGACGEGAGPAHVARR